MNPQAKFAFAAHLTTMTFLSLALGTVLALAALGNSVLYLPAEYAQGVLSLSEISNVALMCLLLFPIHFWAAGLLLRRTFGTVGGFAIAGLPIAGLAAFLGLSWALFAFENRFITSLTWNLLATTPIHAALHLVEFHPWTLVGVATCSLALAALAIFGALKTWQRVLWQRIVLAVGLSLFFMAHIVEFAGKRRYAHTESGKPGGYIEAYKTRTGPASAIIVGLIEQNQLQAKKDWRAARGFKRKKIVSLTQYIAGHKAPQRRPNIVIFVISSLGPSSLQSFSGNRSIMPTLDRLAKRGARYVNAYAASSYPYYPDMTLLSGQYPLRSRHVMSYREPISAPRVLVYDVLAELGYKTAVMSSQNLSFSGVDVFLKTPGLHYLFHAGNVLHSSDVDLTAEERARIQQSVANKGGRISDGLTIRHLKAWILDQKLRKQPFFAYVSLQGSRPPFIDSRDSGKAETPSASDSATGAASLEQQHHKELYQLSLSAIDAFIGDVLSYLKQSHLDDETIVVVMGDKGIAFGDDGFVADMSPLSQAMLRIPIIIAGPGIAKASDSRLARQIDLAPTVVARLGLDNHPAWQGGDLLGSGQPRTAYFVSHTILDDQFGVLHDGLKLTTADRWTASPQLHDLKTDPQMEVNLLQARPRQVAKLKNQLRSWIDVQIGYYQDDLGLASEYVPAWSTPKD